MVSEDHALCDHIRGLLLSYALTHLTTDHVAWTHDATSELLTETLAFVPTTDPHSLQLPVDPFDMLSQKWGLSKLEPYGERWNADPKAVDFMKSKLDHMRSKTKSTEIWIEDSDDVDFECWQHKRPLSPVLTSQAIRQTPRLGMRPIADTVPLTRQDLLTRNGICSVRIDEETERLISVDIALDNRLLMDTEWLSDIPQLFKSIPGMSRASKAATESGPMADFLRCSPPPTIVRRDSPPIFARDKCPGHAPDSSWDNARRWGLGTILQIPDLVGHADLKQDEDGEELFKQHMVVIDGWHAHEEPSSPLTPGTPSLGSSSSEVDELFLPSPPDQNPTFVQSLLSAQIDEHEIPRTEKPGAPMSKAQTMGEGESLSHFLGPLLRSTLQQEDTRIITTPRSQPSSPRTCITTSMLGQMQTEADNHTDINAHSLHYEDSSLNWNSDPDPLNIVERVCGEQLGDEDFIKVVLREQMNEKDALLMEVPMLLSPNEHANSFDQPRTLADMLTVQKILAMEAEEAASTDKLYQYHGFLKKVKGVQPLNLELSWRPFNYGASVPTDEEVSGTANAIDHEIGNSAGSDSAEFALRLSSLLRSVDLEEQPGKSRVVVTDSPSVRGCRRVDDNLDDASDLATETDSEDLVLSREERRRLHGMYLDDESSSDSECFDSEVFALLQPPAKRARFVRGDNLRQTEDPVGRPVDPHGFNPRFGFADLTSVAQGFEGSSDDGNVVPDIDPIHFVDSIPPKYGVQCDPAAIQLAQDPPHIHTADLPEHPYLTDFVTDPGADAGDYDAFLPLSMQSTQSEDVHMVAQFLLRSPDDDRLLAEEDSGYCDFSFVQSLCPEAGDAQPRPPDAAHIPRLEHIQSGDSNLNATSSSPAAATRSSIAKFLALRSRSVAVTETRPEVTRLDPPHEALRSLPEVITEPRPCIVEIPDELIDRNTICLERPPLSITAHRYLASLEVIQKRALVRCLSSICIVELVEREWLGDAHLILDCDTSIQFMSIAALPSRRDVIATQLARASWHFKNILLLFECYPNSWSYGGNPEHAQDVPNLISPPVIKSVKSLRRNLAVAEGCETKNPVANVHYAFARTVEETAMLVRAYGDLAESMDTTGGAIWGERGWLLFDEKEHLTYNRGKATLPGRLGSMLS
ncbi:hypothetical protein OBBRIDRAFT_822683 [Obba rivulosa]|uniref:Uncharacterized protein n=1 Tax=Obba rivulosa TaxID=1052685 RepID=A0A8E2J6M1_9APHY|nr:hypothetical protein OBBRIDRAFT_822683 [Obba rivulosa]